MFPCIVHYRTLSLANAKENFYEFYEIFMNETFINLIYHKIFFSTAYLSRENYQINTYF